MAELKGITVGFNNITAPLRILVMEDGNYDLIIGLPTLISLRAKFALYHNILRMKKGGLRTLLNLEYNAVEANTSDENFTTDSDEETEDDDVETDSSEEEYILSKRNARRTYRRKCQVKR